MSKTRTRLWLPAVLSCCLALPAGAVVVVSGTGNTTAPPDDPGFANVGTYGGASVVYLGNRWVMSAYHVAGSLPASVSFAGTPYATEAGTWQRLTNNGELGMTAFTDLVLFRLNSDPGLAELTIRSGAATVGDDVVMIGNGRDRQAAATLWNITVNPGPGNDVWTETPGPTFDASGYKTDATQSVRWGVNEASSAGTNIDVDGYGDIRAFTTTFNSGAFTHEAQGILGDSGGAVFFKNGADWELAGVIHAVGTFDGQPGNTAVFGNETMMSDLSFYRPQIVSITGIPEQSWAWGGVVVLFGAFLRRRKD